MQMRCSPTTVTIFELPALALVAAGPRQWVTPPMPLLESEWEVCEGTGVAESAKALSN